MPMFCSASICSVMACAVAGSSFPVACAVIASPVVNSMRLPTNRLAKSSSASMPPWPRPKPTPSFHSRVFLSQNRKTIQRAVSSNSPEVTRNSAVVRAVAVAGSNVLLNRNCSGITSANLATWDKGNASVPQPSDAHLKPSLRFATNHAASTRATKPMNCRMRRPNVMAETIPLRSWRVAVGGATGRIGGADKRAFAARSIP